MYSLKFFLYLVLSLVSQKLAQQVYKSYQKCPTPVMAHNARSNKRERKIYIFFRIKTYGVFPKIGKKGMTANKMLLMIHIKTMAPMTPMQGTRIALASIFSRIWKIKCNICKWQHFKYLKKTFETGIFVIKIVKKPNM